MKNSLISKEQLEKAAFDLLASSTPDRYIGMAYEAAKRFLSESQVWSGSTIEETLVPRAQYLWKRILKSKLREPEEIELAVILAYLRHITNPKVDDLLVSIGTSIHRPAAWLAPFARRLLTQRSTTTLFDLAFKEEDLASRMISGLSCVPVAKCKDLSYESIDYEEQLESILASDASSEYKQLQAA